MSKTKLKKLLAAMTAEQLSELVLDLYAARPEAKEYLDFFVSPDIDKKIDKAKSAIAKELYRQWHGRNKSRPTCVRRVIKSVASLNPGSEYVAELMVYSIEKVCLVGSDQQIKQSSFGAYAKLLHDTIVYVDTAGYTSIFLPRIENAVTGMSSSWLRRNEFKAAMKQEMKETLDAL